MLVIWAISWLVQQAVPAWKKRQPANGEAVQENVAAMVLGKRTPPGVYHDFFEELLTLARKHKCSALSVRVTRRNDPTTQMDWRAPVEEALDVFEVKNAE